MFGFLFLRNSCAEAQLRRKAEEQLQLEAQRLTDEQRRETERILMDRERLHAEASQREAERLLRERERLQHEAEIRVRAAESQVAATVEAAVAAALAANAQHSRSPNTERRKAVKLDVPKYSGKDTENLEHWFLAVETAAAAQLLDDQAIIVVFAMSHLMGRAKEWAYSKRLLNRNAFPTSAENAQQFPYAGQQENCTVAGRSLSGKRRVSIGAGRPIETETNRPGERTVRMGSVVPELRASDEIGRAHV